MGCLLLTCRFTRKGNQGLLGHVIPLCVRQRKGKIVADCWVTSLGNEVATGNDARRPFARSFSRGSNPDVNELMTPARPQPRKNLAHFAQSPAKCMDKSQKLGSNAREPERADGEEEEEVLLVRRRSLSSAASD